MGKRSDFPRRPRDHYPTPGPALAPLIPYLVRGHKFCEPCAGDGQLVTYLEALGLVCAYQGDLAKGQDALDIPFFVAPVITNPPYERPLMHALIAHFITAAPSSWLLLEWDWLATKQARPYLPHCTDVLVIGRLRWIPNSPYTGKENYVWCRFVRHHGDGPRLHNT